MIWYSIAITLLILGLIVLLKSWFWDRSNFRGRPKHRCPKCWYDLTKSGDLPITCPECGKVSNTKRSTTRTRRHKRFALFGLLLILASPIAILTPQYRQGTLFAHAPNWMLIELLPFFPTLRDDGNLFVTGNNPGVELITRIARGEDRTYNRFTNEHAVEFINRVADGSIFAPPGSRKWYKTSAYWVGTQRSRFGSSADGWHYLDMTPADEDLIDAIAKLNAVLPKWYPETRDQWPVGNDILIRSDFGSPPWKIELQHHQEVHWKVRGTDHAGSNLHGGSFAIPNIYPVGEGLTIDLNYKMYRSIAYNITHETKGNPIDEHHAVMKTTVVASMNDAIQSVPSPEINKLLIEELIPDLPKYGINTLVSVRIAFRQPVLDYIGMGLRVTLYNIDEPIVEYTPRWMYRDGKLNAMSTGQNEFAPLDEVESRVQNAVKKQALRITIVSDHTLLLNKFHVHRAWTGNIDILYTDAIKQAEGSKQADE